METSAGRYRLGRVLGAGAMGVVHAARDPALDREVAIKLILARESSVLREATDPDATQGRVIPTRSGSLPNITGIDDERLLEEARALARVAHPNIIEVFDVGVCPSGVFIAMELVDGVSLRRWVDEQKPGWRGAVELHLQAGAALAAAHDVGLVHGDFKPDNVLVSHAGRVKVVDFGLARAIGRSATTASDDEPVVTLFGTPAYLAPECWGDATREPSSDQFAFFVSLFEAIAGRRPYGRADSLIELLQQLSTGPELGGAARAMPARLRRAIARGLDPEPRRRFPSMSAALAELRAVLADRGRRWLLAGAVVIPLGIAFAMWPRDEQRAAPDEDALAACARKGESIGEVWHDDARATIVTALTAALPTDTGTADRVLPWLDDYAAQWSSSRAKSCADELVAAPGDGALALARTQCFDARREALAALVETLGTADEAVALRAVRMAADLPAVAACTDEGWLARHPGRADDTGTRDRIALAERSLVRAEFLATAGRVDEALTLTDRAIAEARALQWPPLLARAEGARGRVLVELGRYADAESELDRAYFTAREADDEVAAEIAIELASLVGGRLARFDDAQTWIRHAQTALASRGGPEREVDARLAMAMATIDMRRGALEPALSSAERAREIFARIVGEDHPSVAFAELRLGTTLGQLERAEEAQVHLERAHAILEQALGPEHLDLAPVEHNLAMAANQRGDFDDARAHEQHSLAIRERWLAPDHPDIANSLVGLAYAELGLLRFDEAERGFTRALELRERAFGPDHPAVAEQLANLAQVATARGDCRAAAVALERALGIVEGAGDRRTQLRFRLNLADALLACHEGPDALAQYRAARALAEADATKFATELARADEGLTAAATAGARAGTPPPR